MDKIENSFEIYNQIGEGQFAKVYHAKYRIDQKKYALKIIPATALDHHYIMNEIRLGSLLSHPKITKISFSLRLGQYFCIAMEHNRGCTLNRILTNETLTDYQVQVYSAEIAEALKYLHTFGFVHRDIKPSNILVCTDGIKLIDLGTVSLEEDKSSAITGSHKSGFEKELDSEKDNQKCENSSQKTDENEVKSERFDMLTEKSIFKPAQFESTTRSEMMNPLRINEFRCGTLLYLAPEGKIPKVTTKLDIWSFACLIYRMKVGKDINTPQNPDFLEDLVIYNDFSFLDGIEDESLRNLLENMLKYRQEERFDIHQVINSDWLKEHISKERTCTNCNKKIEKSFAQGKPQKSKELHDNSSQDDNVSINIVESHGYKEFKLCRSCKNHKKNLLTYTGRNNWVFFKDNGKKLNNTEMMLSQLENWGIKNITRTQFENLIKISQHSLRPAYRFGNMISSSELNIIIMEQSKIKTYFNRSKSGCDLFSNIIDFFSSTVHLFSNQRVFFSRMSIFKLEFILNTYFLMILDPELKENRGFDFDLKFIERIGVTKLVLTKTKGLRKDLQYVFHRIKAVILQIEMLNGLQHANMDDFYRARKMNYSVPQFLEERAIQ